MSVRLLPGLPLSLGCLRVSKPPAVATARVGTAMVRWISGQTTAATAGSSAQSTASVPGLPVVPTAASQKQRVVILGSGWAGYTLARSLSASHVDRIVISPRSHFVFTPLLASTSVGTLEFRAALEPVRGLGLTEFHQGWAEEIDFKRKRIRVEANPHADIAARTGVNHRVKGPEFEVEYDKLVIAVGCYSQTFGVQGVSENACFLRDAGDARVIRRNVLQAFENASFPTTSDQDRKRLLHFAVVGGGPTGIEYAAELHDLIHEDLSKMYPTLMEFVAITIYDIAPKVLPMFDQNLATYATRLFKRKGIQIKTEHHLQRIRRDGDVLMMQIQEEPEEVGAGVVVWSTGLKASPLVRKLLDQDIEGVGRIAQDPKTRGIMTDSQMRVQVDPSGKGDPSSTVMLPDVFAIGDCGVVEGQSLPATAQVASQQASYLAKRINKDQTDTNTPFNFRNWGTMAYLGGWRAIHQKGSEELKGRAAWILWRTAYLTKSMSIRNKLMVPVYWLITWLFGRDISKF